MSWMDVLELLEQVGGRVETILPERLEAATATDKGSPDVQIKIAQAHYKGLHRKESCNGQTRWEFG